MKFAVVGHGKMGRAIAAIAAERGHELVATLGEAGVEVVLVTLPVTDDFVALHPDGEADYAEYRAAMAQLADSAGIPFHDLSDASDSFADTHHVNGEGAVAVTESLAARAVPGEARCAEQGS